MPRQQRVSVMVRMNEAHYCDVPGCPENRKALSHYCSRHLGNIHRNGHPIGRPVSSHQWAPYRSKVREVYHSNSSHPGLTRALAWLSAWMVEAEAKDGHHEWASEVSRVKRHGASALDVLVELASCWCYLEDHPRVTLSDTHRGWALSKAVLGLAPRPRRVTYEAARKGSRGYAPKAKPSALAFIGPHLVKVLGPLLINTHQSLQTESDRAKAELEAMRQPFSVTHKTFEKAALEVAPKTQPMKEQQ